MISKKIYAAARFKQQGVATLLLILLMGLGLTVTALGVMHSVRSVQDRQLSVNASTQTQLRAWNGVEIIRRYLETLSSSALDELKPQKDLIISIGSDTETIKARIYSNHYEATDGYTIAVNITAKSSTLAATSIQAVYLIKPSGSTGSTGGTTTTPTTNNAINIYQNLTMTGGLSYSGGTSGNVAFNVEGVVTLTNASVTGINLIRATDNISVNSSIAIDELYSNKSIYLSGSATVLKASALDSINISSGGTQGALYANRNINITNGTTTTANALGFITASSGGAHGTFTAGETIGLTNGSIATANAVGTITTSGSSGTSGTFNSQTYVNASRPVRIINSNGAVQYSSYENSSINAVGSVEINGSATVTVNTKDSITVRSGSLSNLRAEKNLSFYGWGSATGVIGGSLTKQYTNNNNVNITTNPNLSVNLTPVSVNLMSELQPFTMDPPRVDAYEYKDSANYIFEYENGAIKVTTKNISNIEDGSYKIGKIKIAYNDRWGYLCKTLNSSGYCATECATITAGSCSNTANIYKICRGTWDGGECIRYSAGKWVLEGSTSDNESAVAPGILWFAGNIDLTSGFFRNTIIATGNITTSGSHKTWATNYGGYSVNCPNSLYPSIYPTNLCDRTAQTLVANSLGNIALLAGGYVGSTFSGGIIKLGASTEIFGSIVAGDQFSTSGNTTTHGYITAAALGTATQHTWEGSLHMDLTGLPAGYDPGDTPINGGDEDEECTDTSCTSQASVLWTRYL